MIRQYGDPILEQPCEPFDTENPPIDPNELRQEMFKIMKEHRGIGLAANQIGYTFRAFTMQNNNTNNLSDQEMLAINPEVLEESDTPVEMYESCLSFPGINVQITRPHKIKARWTDHNIRVKEEWLSGYTARIFLHELDHLNGVTMKDHISPVKWKEISSA